MRRSTMEHFLLLVGLAILVHGQTLELVSPLQTGSVTFLESATLSISALGVGADGMTTYVEVGAETLAVEISGTVTQTLLATPIPFTATFVEDASRFMIGTTGSGLFQSCTFGADGNGACVNEFVAAGVATTLTTTYSGPVLPWYTLNAAASTATPTSKGASTTPKTSAEVSPSSTPTSPGPSQTAGTSTTPAPSPSNAAVAATHRGWGIWTTVIILPVLLHAL